MTFAKERRITEDDRKGMLKDDRVHAVLRQVQDMKYADFVEVADIFDLQPEDLHRKLEQAIKKRQQTDCTPGSTVARAS
jgi:hypothetical protein